MFWRSLRQDEGQWLKLWCTSPANRKVQLWAGLDASPKQRARMGLGKRALQTAEDMRVDKLRLLKREGVISRDGVPMVKVEPKADGTYAIKINFDAAPEGFSRSDFERRMQDRCRRPGRDSVQWV